jgi:hypothetical protein
MDETLERELTLDYIEQVHCLEEGNHLAFASPSTMKKHKAVGLSTSKRPNSKRHSTGRKRMIRQLALK